MALNVTLRKLLHRKSAEYCAPGPFGNTVAGGFFVSDKSDVIPGHDIAFYVAGTSAVWNYNADMDGWILLPASGVAGTFAAGACGEFRSLSAPGGAITLTATGGTTTTLNTNLSLARNLVGCEVRVVAGPGAGHVSTIKTSQLGANGTITLTDASAVAFTSATQFQVFGGSLWFFNAGTTAVGFAVYDRLTNAWTQRSVTGIPTSWGTDAQLVSTPSKASNKGNGFVNGNATGGSSTTLVTSKTFLLNQWANFQVRIVSGTGAGQIRVISSNTAGANATLTVPAWTTAPDATSVYRIEGNDDVFYLLGNNAVTMYRYSIASNSWTTVAPGTARGGSFAAGGTVDWIDAVQDASWQDETYGNHVGTTVVRQNGRYLFCFRGGNSSGLDLYDIAANTWINLVAYGQQNEGFGAGSCSVDLDGYVYIQKDATGRIFRFDVARNVLDPYLLNPVPQGAAVAGDKMIIATYREGASEITFLYSMGNTRSELTRWVMI